MRRFIVVIVAAALGAPAYAQPTGPVTPAVVTEPVPAPVPSRSRFYTTVGIAVGGTSSDGVSGGQITLVGGALGAELGLATSTNVRIGGWIAVFDAYDESPAVGAEVQIDRPTGADWRIGGRASIAAALNQERAMWTAGLRARSTYVSLGFDAMGFGPSATGRGNGVGAMGTIGLEGRPARYGIVIAGAGGLILGALVLAALSSTH